MVKADVITSEDIMFRSKSRTEQLQDQTDSLACSAATVAEQLRERLLPAVGQATGNAKEWAKPRVERGIEVAAPRLESAVNGLAPKVDTARDKIVDELIPRIAETISAWAVASAAARDEAVSRGQGAAAVISGDSVARPKGKKRRILLALGVLTAAGGAAMAVMKNSAPKDDPWTTPLADQDVATSNGRHSTPGRVGEADAAKTSGILDALDEAGAPSPMDPVGDADLAEIDANGADVNDGGGTGTGSTHKNGSPKNDSDKKQQE
jgi:hypothetical protein